MVLKLKWGDTIIFASIAIIIIAMFVLGTTKKSEGTMIAQISLHDELLYEINLDDLDGSREILFHDGDVKIIAHQGKIRFEKSDCTDLICVYTGWISRPGQIAACLPNRILIKIVGESEEVDVVLH